MSCFSRTVILSFGLVVCCTVSGTAFAEADTELKRKVFQNCEEAKRGVSALSDPQRDEFLGYLGRVIRMESTLVGEIYSEPALPVLPGHNSLGSPNIARIFDPSRENEAKRCAVEIFKQTAPASLIQVPDMIELAEIPTLPGDLRDLLRVTAWEIVTRAAAQKEYLPPKNVIDSLIEQIGVSGRYLAENSVVELHEHTTEILLRELAGPEAKRRERVLDLLFRIDPEGKEIGPRIVPLLGSSDADLRLQILRAFRSPLRERAAVAGAIIAKLADPNNDIRDTARDIVRDIVRNPEDLARVNLGEEECGVLWQSAMGALNRFDDLRRGLARCAELFESTREQIRGLLQSNDNLSKAHGLQLCEFVGEKVSDCDPSLLSSIYADDLSVRIVAVRLAGKLTVRREAVLAAYTKSLKNLSANNRSNERLEFIDAVAEAVASWGVEKGSERLIPYFIESVVASQSAPVDSEFELGPAELALRQQGAKATVPLLKVLKTGNAAARRAAIATLREIRPVDKKTAGAVGALLSDSAPEVRQEAVKALVQLGEAGEKEARRTLKISDASARLAAVSYFAQLGKAEGELSTIVNELFPGVQCEEELRLARKFEIFKQAVQPVVSSSLIDCFKRNAFGLETLVSALKPWTPISADDSAKLIEAIRTRPPAAVVEFAQVATTLGVSSKDLVPLVLPLLGSSDNVEKKRVAALLGVIGSREGNVVGQLSVLVEDKEQETPVRAIAVVSLARLDPGAFDYRKFFLKELKSPRYQWAQQAVAGLPDEIAVPLFVDLLKELPRDRTALALDALAGIGPNAKSAIEQILPHLADSDERIRFAATVAVQRIAPERAEILPAFRRALVGRFRARLLVEHDENDVRAALAEIVKNPQSFVELRAAQELLRQ